MGNNNLPRPFPVAFIARGRLGRIEKAYLDIGTHAERVAIVRKALGHGEVEVVKVPGTNATDAFSRALASKGYGGKPGDIVFDDEHALVLDPYGSFHKTLIRYTPPEE